MTQEFLARYTAQIAKTAAALDSGAFDALVGYMLAAYAQDRQIFVCGNGGSAATANHFVCDFGKNAVKDPDARRFRMLSLSDNVERITAFGNDVAFDEVFRQQLINLFSAGDLLVAVSASGSSPNVVNACRYVKERGGRVVAITGFDGGALKGIADCCIAFPLESYEQIEDLQMMLLHMLTCYIKENQQLLGP